MMNNSKTYKHHRFPAEIISHCVWLYYRFSLSFRDIELMMLERGILITYETIRTWAIKFGRLFSHQLRKRTSYGDQYYLDEVFCKINGKQVYLWRAVDQDGTTIDILVQEKRNQKAAKRFLKKLRKQASSPRIIVTDKLKSYLKPCKQLFTSTQHVRDKGANNRAENAHQPTRLRERKMRRFKSAKQAQLFLACFSQIYDHFNCARHLCSAKTFKILTSRRFEEWRSMTQVASKF